MTPTAATADQVPAILARAAIGRSAKTKVARALPLGTLAADYLKALHSLIAEMEAAMAAIARNSLPDFEESVGKQKTLCDRLLDVAPRLAAGDDSAKAGASSSGTTTEAMADATSSRKLLDQRIEAARYALQGLNQRYAVLLKHTGRSIELLTSLCSSYTEQSYNGLLYKVQINEARDAGSKHQTWDCEM